MMFFSFFDGLGSAFFSEELLSGNKIEECTSRWVCGSSADVSCAEGVKVAMVSCSKDSLLFVEVFRLDLSCTAEAGAVIFSSTNLVVFVPLVCGFIPGLLV